MLHRYQDHLYSFFRTTCWNGVHFMSKITLTPIKIKGFFWLFLMHLMKEKECFRI